MRITKTFKQDCKCGWIREGFMIMYSKTKFKTCFLFRQEKLTKELQKSFTWWINTSSIFQIDNMEGLESLDWQWQFFGAKALDHVSFTGHFTFEEKITLLKDYVWLYNSTYRINSRSYNVLKQCCILKLHGMI